MFSEGTVSARQLNVQLALKFFNTVIDNFVHCNTQRRADSEIPEPEGRGVGQRPSGTQNQEGEEEQGGRDRAPEGQNDELREKVAHSVFLRLSTLLWVG